jgi:hypothetical protein
LRRHQGEAGVGGKKLLSEKISLSKYSPEAIFLTMAWDVEYSDEFEEW